MKRDIPFPKVATDPDTGERYLSKVFNDEWLEENGMGDLVDLAPARGAGE